MQIIDGMHRFEAARSRGQDLVPVRLVDASQADAFLLAVRANVSHGMPLSAEERRVAARRIIELHPAWSDRSIARTTGLAAPTVANIRRCCGEGDGQSGVRIGSDGRVRPLSAVDGRLRASAVIAQRPDASLREVAATAGVSLGTAHDVRRRVRQNLEPVPAGARPTADPAARRAAATSGRAGGQPRGAAHRRSVSEHGRLTAGQCSWQFLRESMCKDPSVRYTDSGRELLRWLQRHVIDSQVPTEKVHAVPPHLCEALAGLALQQAEEWRLFAAQLRTKTA